MDWKFLRNVLLKGLALFVLLNLIFALLSPMGLLGKLSLYNRAFPGRPRLPFGERPDLAYNFSLFSIDAMLGSHEIGAAAAADEYRVVVVGDSSVWGTLLKPQDTLTGNINAAGLHSADGRRVRAYNLGYPTLSLTKDLLLLDRARAYRPDLVIWMVTLESFPVSRQLDSPILQHNAPAVRDLIERYDLALNPQDADLIDESFWQHTLVGQRRGLADYLRLQVYGIPWAATGIDQYYPDTFELRANDLEPETAFHEFQAPHLVENDLAFDVLAAGMRLYEDTPLLLVNEPVFIADGNNSDLRYNFYYPRWAYDDYRSLLAEKAESGGWDYLDAWNLVGGEDFTNSAIHLTPHGSAVLAERIITAIQALDE